MTNHYPDYFLWLCDLIAPSGSYTKLLYILYTTPFYWSVHLDDDRNTDGLRLRDIYMHHTPVSNSVPYGNSSVLEVIIALAIMIEDQLMHDPRLGDRTSEWFWMMISNLGLTGRIKDFSDEKWNDFQDPFTVQEVVDKWLRRDYDPSGYGGLFPLQNASNDQRNVSLLYQIHAFFQEKFGVGNL